MNRDMQELASSFPWGQHIADGGYKSVFRVWNAETDTMEAISVMAVQPEEKHIMVQEMLVSYLVHDVINICPNFINTKQIFRCPHPAPKQLWGDIKTPQPQGHEPSHIPNTNRDLRSLFSQANSTTLTLRSKRKLQGSLAKRALRRLHGSSSGWNCASLGTSRLT